MATDRDGTTLPTMRGVKILGGNIDHNNNAVIAPPKHSDKVSRGLQIHDTAASNNEHAQGMSTGQRNFADAILRYKISKILKHLESRDGVPSNVQLGTCQEPIWVNSTNSTTEVNVSGATNVSELAELKLEDDLAPYFYADDNDEGVTVADHTEMLQTFNDLFEIYGDAECDSDDLESLFALVP